MVAGELRALWSGWVARGGEGRRGAGRAERGGAVRGGAGRAEQCSAGRGGAVPGGAVRG